MLQLAGVEQELASVIGSLALEAAYAGGDARLMTLAVAQERLSAAWSKLSDPAMERLFDATQLWALSRAGGKTRSEPGILAGARSAHHSVGKCESDSAHLLEKALVVAEHADARRRGFMAAWPDKGGASPLVGSANSRLSRTLMNAIRGTLGPESFERISSHPGGAYDRLLHAVAEMASGKKSAKRAFSDVLGMFPVFATRLEPPGAKARHKRAALARQTENERKTAEAAERDALSTAEPCSSNRLLEPGRTLARSQSGPTMSVLAAPFDKHQSDRDEDCPKQRDENIESALKKLN